MEGEREEGTSAKIIPGRRDEQKIRGAKNTVCSDRRVNETSAFRRFFLFVSAGGLHHWHDGYARVRGVQRS